VQREASIETTQGGLKFLRMTYVLFFAAIGTVVPFLNLHFQRLGFSGHEIGLLNALPPAVTLFSATLWAIIADRLHLHNYLLRVMLAGAALSVLTLSLATSFFLIALLFLLYALFQSPVPPLLDTATLEALGEHPERYGELRLWGSLGFIIGTWLLGALIRALGLPRLFFYAYALFALSAAVMSVRLPRVLPRPQPPLWQGVRHVLGSKRWLVFLATLVVVGIANTSIYNFLPLYIHRLGGDERLIGFAWGVGATTEVPTMWASRHILARLGVRGTFLVVVGLYALRMLLYGLLPSAWWVVPVNLLHGVSFTLLWVSSVTFGDTNAPPGMRATGQGVVNGVLFGLAAIVGAPLGGFLYDAVGPSAMYLSYAVMLTALLVVLMVTLKGGQMEAEISS